MSGGVIFRSSVNWTCGGEYGLTVVLISKTEVEANVRTAKWLSREHVSIDGASLENDVLVGLSARDVNEELEETICWMGV